MSPLIRRLLLAFAVIAALVTVFWWIGRPKPIALVVKEIDRGKVESSIANTRAGTIEACQRAKLSTILGGRIEALPIKEGDRVKKGQLLMKLWNDDQQAQSTLAMTQVVTAQQHANDLCAQAANAEREADRQTALREKGFVSTSREDSARTEAKAKRAACDAAKADVVQFQAKVTATRVEQGRTILYAPFDGTVAKIVGEVGEYSTPSPPGIPMPPAVDLIDDSCLYVKAPMDEVDAPKIKAGQPVRISLDALPKQSFPGKVRRVAPYVSAVEKQARTVDIEADFDKPDAPGKLLVGYSADVEVLLDVRDDVVRVPTSALLEGGRVLIAGKNGILEERKIKAGLANWEYTEVLEGLSVGERVVTSLERVGVKGGAHYIIEDKPQAK
ncbi:MAG: efflux RND transporter periplasmic adaptor subunit [Betaproteobacteria bacterium]